MPVAAAHTALPAAASPCVPSQLLRTPVSGLGPREAAVSPLGQISLCMCGFHFSHVASLAVLQGHPGWFGAPPPHTRCRSAAGALPPPLWLTGQGRVLSERRFHQSSSLEGEHLLTASSLGFVAALVHFLVRSLESSWPLPAPAQLSTLAITWGRLAPPPPESESGVSPSRGFPSESEALRQVLWVPAALPSLLLP